MCDRENLINRIQEQSIEEGDCWLWQGHTKDNNLPVINVFIEGKWKCMPVRRAIKVFEGIRLLGRQHQARTSCGNQLCVNPEHVYLFQHKGSRGARINKHHRTPDQLVRITLAAQKHKSKLDWDKVNAIRASNETGPVLAERYGVTKSTINYIKAYRNWKTGEATNANPFAALIR